MNDVFRKNYIPRNNDVSVREIRPGKFEISYYNATSAEWGRDTIVDTNEMSKIVHPLTHIGSWGAWSYYRK